ncbi:ATP-binding protein [Planobispora rosea]|uniref:ATP-binding protein n=2 Tax=Planobispora rosea TaxID=35762 RepID=A0A8J3S0P0_PLARO|nr:ATP-binding protein [Planobispora rosea]GIH84863.1 ATP-binding protein [Planobispora rosea]
MDGQPSSKGDSMEIKIGVRSVHRELVVESDLTAEQVEQELGKALSADRGIFAITDVKGRRILVPMASLGFIEIGEEEARPVGFGGTL